MSRREAVACLAELGEVELSVGAVARLEQTTSMALAPVVDDVAAAVRQALVANLDETGWWEGRKRAWLWTAVTDALTLFRLDPSRSRAVAQALLGPDWRGIVGSDRYAAYQYLPLEQRQFCWAHPFAPLRTGADPRLSEARHLQPAPAIARRAAAGDHHPDLRSLVSLPGRRD